MKHIKEYEEFINELKPATYRSALQKGRDRRDTKGKGIATTALNLLAKKAAQTLAGQSFEVAGSSKNVAKGISNGDTSYINQALMTFTGVGQLHNTQDINTVGSDEVHFSMNVEFQLPNNWGGWAGTMKFKGYKDHKLPGQVQFSIRQGKVWVWYNAAETELEFTRPGARAIAKLADMVAKKLELQTSVKHNSIKQFDAMKPTNESVNEAKHSKVFKSAKKGSYPVSLVVVKNGKVIDQELVNTPEAVPAAFNVIQSKYKGATVHIEDKTGKRLFSESVNEAKYNTVEKVLKKLGRRPSEEELASFITKNYYDVTGVKRQNDDPSRNAKIADLISFYNFDPADFEIAWHYAQNESVNEGKSINAIQKEWAKVTTKMKELAQKFKTAEGDTKSKILSELKDLTKRKKQLERDLDDAVMSKGINQELSSVDEAKYKVNLKADHLSSAEYQKAKKLKAFNPDDWKWNPDEDLYVKTKK